MVRRTLEWGSRIAAAFNATPPSVNSAPTPSRMSQWTFPSGLGGTQASGCSVVTGPWNGDRRVAGVDPPSVRAPVVPGRAVPAALEATEVCVPDRVHANDLLEKAPFRSICSADRLAAR
jgi:hypothetical protein